MEIKLNAIVIKAIDYKENDRLLTLFSLERGVISAGIKGVKKAGAKLKFASEPFCFAEYILVEKGGRYTVINASHIDSFYSLRLNLKKYYSANAVAEAIKSFSPQEMAFPELFELSISVIKNICYTENSEYTTLIKFLLLLCDFSGYLIEIDGCARCGMQPEKRVFFDFDNAVFICENCFDSSKTEISIETYNLLCKVSKTEFEELKDDIFEEKYIKKSIKFLNYYLLVKTDLKLVSLQEILNDA